MPCNLAGLLPRSGTIQDKAPPVPTTRTRRRATATPLPRRNALIAAAERVFLRHGYHATTMDEVAAAAAMSKRTLYQLVPSKEALFAAILEHRHGPLHVEVETTFRPVDAVLNDLLNAWARHMLSPSLIALARLIMAEYAHGKTLSRLLERLIDREGAKPCRDAVREYFVLCNASGQLALDDPMEAAQMLYGMAIGNIHIELLFGIGRPPTRAEIEGRIARAVSLFLAGARARSSRTHVGKAMVQA